MAGKLYVVGTPIGNLGDFSPRAAEILSSVDFIAAEDTRVTAKLCNHFGIKKPLLSYYEHNKEERGEEILARLASGECCAIVTDAGMPCISDPGEDLVRKAHDAGIPVESVPGPSALVTALALSGMNSGRFTFEGFLSVNKPSRKEHLAGLVNEKRTMIFYEAPHKLCRTLADLYACFGDRQIALVRELTKVHEQVMRTTLAEAVEYYTENTPRGEFVLILAGNDKTEEEPFTLEQAVDAAKELLKKGDSVPIAAKKAAELSGFRKNEIYRMLLAEKE